MTVGDEARESEAREERNNTTERKDQAQGKEQKGRKIEEENDQKEARTPAICHGDLTYRGILDVSYLPLIAASVIQAEDKRGRNKIRTGSTGLPYSPLLVVHRRAEEAPRPSSPRSPLEPHSSYLLHSRERKRP